MFGDTMGGSSGDDSGMTGNASADNAVSREIGSGGKRRPPFPAVPLLVFAALAAAVSLAGLASYRGYAAAHRARARVRLEALASHLADEVGAWRDERFADAGIVASEPALARSLSRPRGQLDGDELVLWFEALRTQRHYAGVALLDTGGEPALAVGVPIEALKGDPGCAPGLVRQALESGAPSLSDFHRSPAGGLHLDLLAPVRLPGTRRPVGALLFRVDPTTRLLPVLASSPASAGPGSRVRLVRREGGEAVELGAPANGGEAAERRFPLADRDELAVRAVLGEEVLLAGGDGDASHALAVARHVPGSGWSVLVETDEAELLATDRERGRSLGIAVVGLISAAGGGLALLWRRRTSDWSRREARAEAEHAALVGRLHQLAATMNDMVFLVDEESRIIEANDRASQALGYAPEELTRLTVRDIRDPATLGDMQAIGRLEPSQVSSIFETRYRRKDGSTFPVELSVRALEQGGRRLFHGVARDITERKRAMAALQEGEERLALALEATNDGVWDWDLARDAIHVSPRWARMLGYEPGEIVTVERARQVVHPDDRSRLDALYGELFSERAPMLEIEMRVRPKSGQWRWVLNRAKVVKRDQAGRPLRVVGAYTDITERRALQTQLLLADRMASLGTLAAGVAHEINNPLAFTAVNLAFARAEVRRLGLPDPELEKALEEAEEGATRVRDIVRDLKAFSRDEDVPGCADPREVLRAAVNLAQNEIRPRAHVELDLGETPPVAASERRLGQVLVNLLVNAAQAIPEGAPQTNAIRARTRTEGDKVVVEIEDTGTGIAPELLGRIFDPFFTTKPVGVGTGLGLSICHGIVTSLGGDIQVESEPGRGSLFRVRLPAAHDREVPATAGALAPRGRILVVDDEPMVGRAISRILGAQHEVIVVTSGEAALARLRAGPEVDLVLCDLMMPGLSGMDLFEQTRQAVPATSTRFVFLTGGAFTDRTREFLERVPNPRLDKPFDPDGLRRAVAGLLLNRGAPT
jgi:PAS domain S-box-containing protein